MATYVTDHDPYQAFLINGTSSYRAGAEKIRKIKKDLDMLDMILEGTMGPHIAA